MLSRWAISLGWEIIPYTCDQNVLYNDVKR
jgi:hypothetical protein